MKSLVARMGVAGPCDGAGSCSSGGLSREVGEGGGVGKEFPCYFSVSFSDDALGLAMLL